MKTIIYTSAILLTLGVGSYFAVKAVRKATNFKKEHELPY